MSRSSASQDKACPGTCRGRLCAALPSTYILAACEGTVCLFEQCPDGRIAVVMCGTEPLFPSVSAMQDYLCKAEASLLLGPLVVVGSACDIAWMHSCLPEVVARHISAEIEYPLVHGWFQEVPAMGALTRALEQLLRR